MEKLSHTPTELAHFINKQLAGQYKQLLFTLSHDFQAPVRHISGFGELLQKELRKNGFTPLAAEFLERMLHAQKVLNAYNQCLIRFGRTGNKKLSPDQIDLHGFIEEKKAKILTRYDATIHTEVDNHSLRTDAELLATALQELVLNSIQHTRCPELTIKGYIEGNYTIIEVIDNGPGISAKSSQKLFTIFNKKNNKAESPSIVLGCGSAIAMNCANRLQGTINWYSIPEQETCFTLKTPTFLPVE